MTRNPSQTLRYAAKALIIENDRLLCLRKQGDIGGYYVLPGGGQDPGELLPDTLRRECLEELGAAVEVGRLRFVQEYVGSNHLFKDVHGRMHFVNLYFECRLLEPVLTHPLSPDAGQVGLEWLDISRLGEAAFFPRVLAGKLGTIAAEGPVYLGDSV
ncbi:MAG: hydrolase [Fibrobacteres bacterium]|nr:hydrolase [Fibrobacterota bacterium]